jgi:CubicO group peptidase (beta-lactamase class C family)
MRATMMTTRSRRAPSLATSTIQSLVIAFVMSSPCLAEDVSRIDQLVQSYVPSHTFMGAVLIARGSEVVFKKGYGSANLEWDIPNSTTTKFRLGSLTKQFTAASILLLEERGKLKVDDVVKKYLPDTPASWDKITVFHLLTHTSGIPNFTAFPEYPSLQPFPSTVEKIVARFRDKPLDFQPGEKWAYSNSGYLLLGYLIEKVTGGSYEQFLQENIFAPLGMKDSGYDSNTGIIRNRAAGYSPGPSGPVNAGFVHMSIPHAAGALYSTAEDLLRWEEGLFGGKVLSPASLQKMTTPVKSDYACGLIVHESNRRKVISHNGGIEGFNTYLAYYPQDKLTVVVLANLNGPVPDELGPKLGALVHGDAVQLPSERKEVTLSAEVLARNVGTYELVPGVNMMITLDGDHLMAQLSGQPKFQLFAESETAFFLKVVDAQIEFGKDAQGRVVSLVLHQNGRDQKANRTSDTVLERKEIAVAPTLLATYVGTYELQPGFDLVITLEGVQLMAQATGQPKFPLFAESDTRFFLKVVDAQVDFGKDDKGSVTHLVLHQGGRDMKAMRK